jgi:hypothetical protein
MSYPVPVPVPVPVPDAPALSNRCCSQDEPNPYRALNGWEGESREHGGVGRVAQCQRSACERTRDRARFGREGGLLPIRERGRERGRERV